MMRALVRERARAPVCVCFPYLLSRPAAGEFGKRQSRRRRARKLRMLHVRLALNYCPCMSGWGVHVRNENGCRCVGVGGGGAIASADKTAQDGGGGGGGGRQGGREGAREYFLNARSSERNETAGSITAGRHL